MAFETTSISKLKAHAETLAKRVSNLREKAERGIDAAMTVVEVAGTSFAWGYVNGRWGMVPANATSKNTLPEYTVANVPVDMGIGIALVGMGLLGGSSKYEEHFIRVGAASLGAFGFRSGFQMGADAYQNSSGQNSRTTTVTAGRPRGAMGGGDRGGVNVNTRERAGVAR